MALRWYFLDADCPGPDEVRRLGELGWQQRWTLHSAASNQVFMHKQQPLVLKRLPLRRLKQRVFFPGRRAFRGSELLRRMGLRAPRCYAYGREGDECLIVLERVEGMGLANVLQWVLASDRSLHGVREQLVSLLAEQVAQMHQIGIVHGDLRLNNVLVHVEEPQQPSAQTSQKGRLVLTFIDNDRTRSAWQIRRERHRNLVQINTIHQQYFPDALRRLFLVRYSESAPGIAPGGARWGRILQRAEERTRDAPVPSPDVEAVARLRTALAAL